MNNLSAHFLIFEFLIINFDNLRQSPFEIDQLSGGNIGAFLMFHRDDRFHVQNLSH